MRLNSLIFCSYHVDPYQWWVCPVLLLPLIFWNGYTCIIFIPIPYSWFCVESFHFWFSPILENKLLLIFVLRIGIVWIFLEEMFWDWIIPCQKPENSFILIWVLIDFITLFSFLQPLTFYHDIGTQILLYEFYSQSHSTFATSCFKRRLCFTFLTSYINRNSQKFTNLSNQSFAVLFSRSCCKRTCVTGEVCHFFFCECSTRW